MEHKPAIRWNPMTDSKESTRSDSFEQDAFWVRMILREMDPAQREECFRSLMVKYWRLVGVMVAQRLGNDRRDAEDVTQEAFFRAFRSLKQLSEPTAFLGWLLKIARNLATDHLRTKRRTVSLDALGESSAQLQGALQSRRSPEFEKAIELNEETTLVMRALAELPECYREVVTLKYMQGLDGREMARLLNEPEGTIRNRLFRALDKLRRSLDKQKACKS